jgi:hypothetical protein
MRAHAPPVEHADRVRGSWGRNGTRDNRRKCRAKADKEAHSVCQLPSSNAARRRKGIGPATLDVLRPDVSLAALMAVSGFGKHRGERFHAVPRDYLG